MAVYRDVWFDSGEARLLVLLSDGDALIGDGLLSKQERDSLVQIARSHEDGFAVQRHQVTKHYAGFLGGFEWAQDMSDEPGTVRALSLDVDLGERWDRWDAA